MGKYNLNVRISEQERQILDEYCQASQRTQSDVIREFIRMLSKKTRAKIKKIDRTDEVCETLSKKSAT